MEHRLKTSHGPSGWKAYCNCGWVGQVNWFTQSSAESDADNHLLVVIKE